MLDGSSLSGENALFFVHLSVIRNLTGTLFAGHLSFLSLNHFLNHITAYGTVLFGCEVSVVTVGQRYSQLAGYLVLELVKGALGFGYCCSIR